MGMDEVEAYEKVSRSLMRLVSLYEDGADTNVSHRRPKWLEEAINICLELNIGTRSAMVKKVAHAIWEVRRKVEDRTETLDEIRNDHEVWDEARAAIDAMHDPDHDMTLAVVGIGEDRSKIVSQWNKMVDEALR